jgi:hypothetical protein
MENYPTNQTDKQWKVIEKIINDQRKRKYSIIIVWNAVQNIIK